MNQNKSKIKIVFMGTPEFSVPILKALLKNYQVVGVVTKPDKETGRNRELKFSPIKTLALANNLPVLQPEKIKTDYQNIIDLKPDLIVTCAYGQIIPKDLLDYPRYGCINVHASLLPKLRGGAPIHHALIGGWNETGITIMYMNEKMDEGDIISQRAIPIMENDNLGTLHDKLSQLGSELLIQTLPEIIAGTNKRVPQDHRLSTYAYTIKREDELLDFNKTTKEVYNQIRGLNPYPGSYSLLENRIVKVYEGYPSSRKYDNLKSGQITSYYQDGIGVKTKDGEMVLTVVQFDGKKKMKVTDYLRGNKKNLIGKVFNRGD